MPKMVLPPCKHYELNTIADHDVLQKVTAPAKNVEITTTDLDERKNAHTKY